jgi:predicted TIM-barrel fold metal-dependent hydrolase
MSKTLLLVAVSVACAWSTTSCKKVPAIARDYPTKDINPKSKDAYEKNDDPSLVETELPRAAYGIVDIHEHAQFEKDAETLLKAMDEVGIRRSCLQAATIYTFTLNDKYGFEQYQENNQEIIKIKKRWPDRFCAFVTFDPLDANHLQQVKNDVAAGADGVKLYVGHGAKTGKGPFHVMALDDPRMEPFFAYAEATQLPVLMHVNLNKYWDETVSLLEKHPNLRLCLPHFGLHKNTEARLNRLGWLLDRYPNLFTDMSYGHHSFHIEGFDALAKTRSRTVAFLKRYADRVMFASDIVLESTKTWGMVLNTLRSYRQFNELERFRFFLVPERPMKGLGLDAATVKKMYEEAPARFLLLDGKSQLVDRTQAPPVVAPVAVPPLDMNTIPDDNQYVPRTDGKNYGAAVTLGRAGVRDTATETSGANGESDHGDGDDGECE